MKIEQSKFLVDLEVVDEKVKSLHKISVSLIKLFQNKELDSIANEVAKRQGIINGFLDACKMIASKISRQDSDFTDKPLSYLQDNSEGQFQVRVTEILKEWQSILSLEEKIQNYAQQLPKIMKENLILVQKARPALKAYSGIADVNAATESRFERKK
ncbi:MAG: hypothetical protein KC646_18020 [Candidatus Cloacimonetes bacterium]|nr:hypothetical protein [Candidatus Cloacimonadota bacterium]